MQWCSSCHPGMPGADICTSFRWIETLAKVARLFAKACEISESQWSGNKGQFQYQKSKQERIKSIENPCKVATIYYHFEILWLCMDVTSTSIAEEPDLEEFIEVHSIIRRQGLQQMDLQWGCGPSPSFLGGGSTWRFIHGDLFFMSDVMLPEKSDKISQICWCFFGPTELVVLKNLKLIKFHFEHFFSGLQTSSTVGYQLKGLIQILLLFGDNLGCGGDQWVLHGWVGKNLWQSISQGGQKMKVATMELFKMFILWNTWKFLRLPPSRHSFHWCLLPSLHLEL